jgi:peptidyl-prolyl cis-trans isomerase A (cyclophilin A)
MIEFYRDWSPHGYDRAVSLFEKGFYDHTHFYRVVPNFLVQFGINYDPDLMDQPKIPDDPKLNPLIPFETGTVAFAGSGPNSRTTQLFISYKPTTHLGAAEWETPLGKVVQGMEHVNAFYSYGDMPPWVREGKIVVYT